MVLKKYYAIHRTKFCPVPVIIIDERFILGYERVDKLRFAISNGRQGARQRLNKMKPIWLIISETNDVIPATRDESLFRQLSFAFQPVHVLYGAEAEPERYRAAFFQLIFHFAKNRQCFGRPFGQHHRNNRRCLPEGAILPRGVSRQPERLLGAEQEGECGKGESQDTIHKGKKV